MRKVGNGFLKFDLPADLRTAFVLACNAHGITQAAMLRHLITWWLEDLASKEEKADDTL